MKEKVGTGLAFEEHVPRFVASRFSFLLSVACLLATLFAAPVQAEEVFPIYGEFDGQETPAGNFLVSRPSGLAINGANGHILVADNNTPNLYEFDANNNYLATWDGSGTPAGSFGSVRSVAANDTTGDVYVADPTRQLVVVFDSDGNYLATWNGSATPAGLFGPESPIGVAVDQATGNVYVADSENHVLDVFNPGGTYLFQITGEPDITLSTHYSNSIAINGVTGNVYVADSGPVVTFEFDSADGKYLSTWDGYNTPAGSFGGFYTAVAANNTSGNVYIADTQHEAIDIFGPAGAYLDQIQVPGMSNEPPSLAIEQATGKLFVSQGNRVRIYGPHRASVPNVTTGAASGITPKSVTLSGNVDPAGSPATTECYFKYGPSTNYGKTAPCTPPAPHASPTDVSANLSGLTPGATYHFKLFAATGGINSGGDQVFTTPYVAGVSTGPASEIKRSSAKLSGSLDPDGIDTTYYFQWGLTTGYGNTSPLGPPGSPAGSTPGSKAVATEISGLKPETVYHYRLVAINIGGKTLGNDRTLTTDLAIKDLATGQPTEIGPETATLNGALDPDGFDTTYHFEWGPTQTYGNSTPAVPAGSSPGSTGVSAGIAGLEDYRLYHYRLVSTNQFGTTVGGDVAFLSAPPFLPTIGETASSDLTRTSVTLSATINPGFGPTAFRFQYGPNSSYGFRTAISAPIGDDGTEHRVSTTVDGLAPGTTYHYRAVGINFSGSTVGPDRTFTTSDVPRLDLVSASAIGPSSATLTAQIVPAGAATTYHFEYGPDLTYGNRTPESGSIGSDTAGHGVANEIAGLASVTTYHFRIVATNENGSVASGDHTFKTPAATIQKEPPPKCKRGFVRRHGRCVKQKHKRKSRKHRSDNRHHG